MIDIKSMIENESVEDVVMVLAPTLDYSRIDNWYVRNKFEIIGNGLIIKVFTKLIKEGKLCENEVGDVSKGPNWQPPQFVLEKKYGIE